MSGAATVLQVLTLAAAMGGLLGALRYYQVRREPDPESVRKLFHIGGGGLGLLLPWLFDDVTPVLVLALLLTFIFVAIRIVPSLREGVGQVLFGVHRNTIGEFGFLASIVLLFWLSHGNKLLYTVPLLVLALADAFAALIGEQYGKLPLHIWKQRKSYEGAAAFILVAFFCVHVPVLLFGDTGRLESLLIAADVSVMVMMAEVAAWWGLDNIIIPVWAYMLLKALLVMDAAQLSAHLGFLLALALFMRFWRGRTTLGDDALFGATLWGYVVWAAGGWQWVIAPIVTVAIYATITARTPIDQLRVFRFPVVLANIAGSMFWLLGYRQSAEPALIVPFAACYGADVAIIALVRQKLAVPDLPLRRALSINVAKGMLPIVPTVFLLDGFRLTALLDLASSLIAVYAATALFCRVEPRLVQFPVDTLRWVRQGIAVSVASPLALGVHYGAMPDPASLRIEHIIDLLSR